MVGLQVLEDLLKEANDHRFLKINKSLMFDTSI